MAYLLMLCSSFRCGYYFTTFMWMDWCWTIVSVRINPNFHIRSHVMPWTTQQRLELHVFVEPNGNDTQTRKAQLLPYTTRTVLATPFVVTCKAPSQARLSVLFALPTSPLNWPTMYLLPIEASFGVCLECASSSRIWPMVTPSHVPVWRRPKRQIQRPEMVLDVLDKGNETLVQDSFVTE